jgi:hypothetical protein
MHRQTYPSEPSPPLGNSLQALIAYRLAAAEVEPLDLLAVLGNGEHDRVIHAGRVGQVDSRGLSHPTDELAQRRAAHVDVRGSTD